MQPFIDAHCHLTAPVQSVENGGYICNATRPSDWSCVLKFAKQNKNVAPCVGVHPWYMATAIGNWAQDMRDILIATPNAMVGEIGLDCARDNIALQMSVFITQIEIAAQLHRAIHVHCVRAWDKIAQIFRAQKFNMPVVFHGFHGNWQIVKMMSDLCDAYFSVSNADTDKMRDVILAIPRDKILVESDKNIGGGTSAIIRTMAQIAQIKSISESEITQNALQVIKNGQTGTDTFIIR